MGASNVLAAHRLYAGKVPPMSLAVLAYIAAVSLDKDAEPSWWEGHDILAVRCFGYAEPVTRSDLRAVERAVTSLFRAGAITSVRHSGQSGNGKVWTARYRLWLAEPAPEGKRRSPPDGKRRVNGGPHPTKNGPSPDEKRSFTRRKPPDPIKMSRRRQEERDNKGSALTGTGGSNQPAAARSRAVISDEEWEQRERLSAAVLGPLPSVQPPVLNGTPHDGQVPLATGTLAETEDPWADLDPSNPWAGIDMAGHLTAPTGAPA
jgi:hypothetical protein